MRGISWDVGPKITPRGGEGGRLHRGKSEGDINCCIQTEYRLDPGNTGDYTIELNSNYIVKAITS